MTAIPLKYLLPLLGLTVSAFVFNTSEFMPIGLLIDISHSFSMTESETGMMITVYAWVVALLSLPLMLLASQMNVRKLLLLTLGCFIIGQAASGLAVNFPMLLAARILVACAHSIFWSIATPLAARLVTREHRPLALSMVAVGSSVAMILGLPLGRVIGLYAGWRMTFLLIAAVSFGIFLYLWKVFPSLTQSKTFSKGELPELLRQPTVQSIYLTIVLFATSYFTVYSYIEPFLKNTAGFTPEEITLMLILLGVSGLIGSVLFSRFYGRYRFGTILVSLFGLFTALFLWQSVSVSFYTMIGTGMFIGVLSTLFNIAFQAELIAAVPAAAASVAMSIYSGIFNLGIGSGTFIGGQVTALGHLPHIGYVGAFIALFAALCCSCWYIPTVKDKK